MLVCRTRNVMGQWGISWAIWCVYSLTTLLGRWPALEISILRLHRTVKCHVARPRSSSRPRPRRRRRPGWCHMVICVQPHFHPLRTGHGGTEQNASSPSPMPVRQRCIELQSIFCATLVSQVPNYYCYYYYSWCWQIGTRSDRHVFRNCNRIRL